MQYQYFSSDILKIEYSSRLSVINSKYYIYIYNVNLYALLCQSSLLSFTISMKPQKRLHTIANKTPAAIKKHTHVLSPSLSLSDMSAFDYNKLNPSRRAHRGQNPIPQRVLSSISIIHIDPCAFDVRTGPFVHFHTSKEFISVDLCYNDSRREEKKSRQHNREPTDTIFIYCCVCLCFIMSRWGDRGARWGQKETEKESCIQMKECWGRWDGVG